MMRKTTYPLSESLKEENKDIHEEKTNEDLEKELEETKDKCFEFLQKVKIQENKLRKTNRYGKIWSPTSCQRLISVVDNFERALNSLNDETDKKTLEGFGLIQKEIVNILDKFNVKEIQALANLLMQTFIRQCLKSLQKNLKVD